MSENDIYKVLIVDDDKFLLDVYSIKFREFGHTVEVAFGGEEALEKIKNSDNFDAIITDVVMPNMDGFEFLQNMREKNLAKNSAIIVLTNQGENKDIERARSFNIVKASTVPSEVFEEVLKIIRKHKTL
jgi:two-component system, chemotaxis family, chemotaxis protein CheY